MAGQSITVLGCGSWGGTLAQSMAEGGHKVRVWHRDPERIKSLDQTRRHYLIKTLSFSRSIRFLDSLDQALAGAEYVFVAVPSHAVRDVINQADQLLAPAARVINLAKGLERDSLLTMSQVIAQAGGIESDRIVSLYGPSHAEEVVEKLPTTLVAACPNLETAASVQRIVSSPYLRVYTNSDVLGVELGGSLKNVIAIAAGICDGIRFGDNTKAAVLTRGIAEITRLGVVMGANPDTFAGLSGIGDVIATCLSSHSRNRYVGEEIGRGRTLDDILTGMKMVAEGINTTRSIYRLQDKYQVELPISAAVYEILFGNKDPLQAVRDLMNRDLVQEQTG